MHNNDLHHPIRAKLQQKKKTQTTGHQTAEID